MHKMSAQVIIRLWKKKIIVNCVTLSRVNESFLIIRKQYIKNVFVFLIRLLAVCNLFTLTSSCVVWYRYTYHHRDPVYPVYRLVLVFYLHCGYVYYTYIMPFVPSNHSKALLVLYVDMTRVTYWHVYMCTRIQKLHYCYVTSSIVLVDRSKTGITCNISQGIYVSTRVLGCLTLSIPSLPNYWWLYDIPYLYPIRIPFSIWAHVQTNNMFIISMRSIERYIL